MHYLIYKITNTINNKIYIGKHKTENINDDYMGSGKLLHRALEKYGLDKFKKEILFECSNEEEMNQKEAEIVNDEFIARLDTYNIKLGGQGGFDYINSNSMNNTSNQYYSGYLKGWKKYKEENYDEWKNIMSSDEVRQKVSNGLKFYFSMHNGNWLGKKHTKESKLKIGRANSIHQKGINNSNYGNCWIYNDTLKISKTIKKDEIDVWIQKGWKKGRKIKFN